MGVEVVVAVKLLEVIDVGWIRGAVGDPDGCRIGVLFVVAERGFVALLEAMHCVSELRRIIARQRKARQAIRDQVRPTLCGSP